MIRTIGITLSGVVAIELYKYFTKKGVLPITSAVTSSVLSTVLYNMIQFVVKNVLIKKRFFRNIIDNRSKFEGCWIIRIRRLPETPYNFINISYNNVTDEYIIDGVTYTSNGQHVSHFISNSLHFQNNFRKMIYFYCVQGENGGTSEGFGKFTLDAYRERGSGFFVNTDVNMIRSTYGERSVF